MLKKNPFLTGTLLLTLTGLLSRVIGFFYRIFLSRSIGEEGMGIYQLTAPVMALSFSLTSAGIQTAISKYTASYMAQHKKNASLHILLTGFTISMLLSILTTVFLYQNADWISSCFLLEKRCGGLVRIYALSIPFGCIHSCINGYYYGLKKAAIPAASQLLEQLTRVGTVYAIFSYGYKIHAEPTITTAMFGILVGEIFAMLLSVIAIYIQLRPKNSADPFESHPVNRSHRKLPMADTKESSLFPIQRRSVVPSAAHQKKGFPQALSTHLTYTREIMSMALPLMGNRLVLNGLQSVEAVYIPNRLMAFGMTNSQALSNYGVLTGMALPLLLFPSAVTGSVSVLLLPYISEAEAQKNRQKIRSAIRKCIIFCLLLGSFCCLFLLVFGDFLGQFLFDSQLAGTYIKVLSITCPVLYMGSVLTSILHGLGKAFSAFVYNATALLVRLAFVFLLIPRIGMYGYLIGVLVSQLLFTFLMLYKLRVYTFDSAKS